jgi:hypothetical protein
MWYEKYFSNQNKSDTVLKTHEIPGFEKRPKQFFDIIEANIAISVTWNFMKNIAVATLSLFSSTYLCELFFSTANFVKPDVGAHYLIRLVSLA